MSREDALAVFLGVFVLVLAFSAPIIVFLLGGFG